MAEGFLIVPWLRQRTDYVYRDLAANGVSLLECNLYDLFCDGDEGRRGEIYAAALHQPDAFRDVMRRVFAPWAGKVDGLILTMDWAPPQRRMVEAARDLGIPTSVVLHEGVFADAELYYRCPHTGANRPVADQVVVWGSLHVDLFARRGYPRERLFPLGSIKFDQAAGYRARLDTASFRRQAGLPADRPVVTFALQPLDNQYGDEDAAILRQEQAASDLLTVCELHGWSLLLRLPPERPLQRMLPGLGARLAGNPAVVVQGGPDRLGADLSPLEVTVHSAVVLAINSTMLVEAALLGVPSVQLGYLPIDLLWHRCMGLPRARHAADLLTVLPDVVASGTRTASAEGMAWLADVYGARPEGGAAAAIAAHLVQAPPPAFESELFTSI